MANECLGPFFKAALPSCQLRVAASPPAEPSPARSHSPFATRYSPSTPFAVLRTLRGGGDCPRVRPLTVRTAFIQELIRQARVHPRLFLVVGDLGYSVVEPFVQEFPDRFLNAGVAEQNMTAVAAGLASEGWQVFTYSIANFPTLRCLEQIRNDVCYHRLPVTVVAVGAGLAYGNLGFSHHGVHDLAALRALPHLAVLSPADPGEAAEAVQWAVAHPGPTYLRLGKAGEKTLHRVRGLEAGPLLIPPTARVDSGPDGAAGSRPMPRGLLPPGGTPLALVATGSVVSVALAASDVLGANGVPAAVFSCPWLKPATADFFAALWRYPRIITLEEHVLAGGFGSLLRELAPDGVRIRSLGVPEELTSTVGSQEYLRAQAGLTVEGVIRVAKDF